jgi:hypothetical protein
MNVRFGAFEVDLEGRRLLKRGMPITLREQSFQVLAALMERPGEIVTREELRQRLWSSDTFVDFEVALNPRSADCVTRWEIPPTRPGLSRPSRSGVTDLLSR